jgi:hypothetical protein
MIPQIPDLAPYPLPTDPPAVFNTKANAYVISMDALVPALQDAIDAMNEILLFAQVVNTNSTSLTIVQADAGKYFRLTADTAKLITITEGEYTMGTTFNFRNVGDGNATIEDDYFNLNFPAGSVTGQIPPGGAVSLVFVDESTFDVIGLVE